MPTLVKQKLVDALAAELGKPTYKGFSAGEAAAALNAPQDTGETESVREPVAPSKALLQTEDVAEFYQLTQEGVLAEVPVMGPSVGAEIGIGCIHPEFIGQVK